MFTWSIIASACRSPRSGDDLAPVDARLIHSARLALDRLGLLGHEDVPMPPSPIGCSNL